LKVEITEMPFIAQLFETAETVSDTLRLVSWEILVANRQSGFISCDDPVVVVPPRGVVEVGFLVPGTVTYLPLTRSLCLRLGGVGHSFSYRDIDRQTVRIINQNIAAHSERFMMGPVREQLENVVLRSGSTHPELTARFTLETVKQDDSGSLQMIVQNTRRYFYEGVAERSSF
jgi:hypothetical protein